MTDAAASTASQAAEAMRAAAEARRRADLELTPGQRLEQLHRLCQQMGALRLVSEAD